MNATISDLKGLQPEVKTKLEFEGIRNTQQFLERTRTPQQRTELAHKVGTTSIAIKELANRADLMRLTGVGLQPLLSNYFLRDDASSPGPATTMVAGLCVCLSSHHRVSNSAGVNDLKPEAGLVGKYSITLPCSSTLLIIHVLPLSLASTHRYNTYDSYISR